MDEVGLELLVAGGPGGGDGRGDATGRVLLPGHARGEFLGPVTGEDEVVVAVDEAGDHGFTAEVDGLESDAGSLAEVTSPLVISSSLRTIW